MPNHTHECWEPVIPPEVWEIVRMERLCSFPKGHLGEHGPLKKVHAVHSAERRAELLRMWRCGNGHHTDCWANTHTSSEVILTEATYCCADSCTCWRHAIAAHFIEEPPPEPEYRFDWPI